MRTILFALLLLPIISSAQTGKRIPFAAGRKVDTAYDKASLIVDSAVKIYSLANVDPDKVLTVDSFGLLKLKDIGTVLGLDNVLQNNAVGHQSLFIGKVNTVTVNKSATIGINVGDSSGFLRVNDSSGTYVGYMNAYSPGNYGSMVITDPVGRIEANAGGPNIGFIGVHYISSGSAPSITAHGGAGTAPTLSISGADAAFTVILTAGVSPTLGDTIATVTYALPYLTGSTVRGYTLSPVNANAANLAKQPYFIRTGSTRTKTELMGGGAVLIAGQTYEWSATIMR